MGNDERIRHFIKPICILCITAAVLAFMAREQYGGGPSIAAAAAAAVLAAAAGMYQSAALGKLERSVDSIKGERDYYAALFEQNPAAMFLIDEKFKMTDCNQAALEFMDYSEKSALTSYMSGLIEADFRAWSQATGFHDSVIKKLREAARDGTSEINTILSVNGVHRNVLVTCGKIRAGDGFVIEASITDTSELYRVKEGLYHRDKLFDVVNRAAVILLSSEAGHTDSAQRRAMELMGRAVDIDRIYLWMNRVIGGRHHYVKEFEWLGAGDGARNVSESSFAYDDSIPEWEEMFHHGTKVNGPLANLSPRAKECLAPYGVKSILVIPILFKNKFWGFVSFDDCRNERVFSDDEVNILLSGSLMIVSSLSRDRMERERSEALAQAMNTSKAKSDFLSNMSHEMRTPMNAIIGMTSIGRSSSDIARKDYAFDRIAGASRHLLGVINDVLDMSKIEADKLELSEVSFNFEHMLQNVVNVINFRVDERDQTFYVTIDRQIPALLIGDDQRLAQVITNLLANAVKFTPDRGTVRINAHLAGQDNGFCVIRIEVVDTGVGITPEQQSRIFKSFEQAESGTSRKFGGTGLGLAISKRIVEMMGGEIWVQSEPGKGSTFAFTVRLRPSDEAGEAILSQSVNWREVSVLVADAEEEITECFQELTRRSGVRCDIAGSNAELYRMMERNGPHDVYFVDWRSHGIDGREAVRRIRAAYGDRAAIVAMLSATELAILDEDEKEAGAGKFLTKPIFLSAIEEMLNECLSPESTSDGGIDGGSENFGGHRILLAEDVDVNREIVQALLEPTGLEIDTAENGAVAVRMFEDNPNRYDMIFMDVQMPEVDGYEATRLIRNMGTQRGRTIPIVAMTANVFREDIEKCLEAGMNDHVGKPLNLDEVLQKLRIYLQSGKDSAQDKNMIRYNAPQNEPSPDWEHGIAWNPKLETGHEKIDSQHKELFKLTSDLAESCANGGSVQSVGNALDFLASYAVNHFAEEEELMELHGYPEYSAHKQKHDDFKGTVAELINTYKATGSTAGLSSKVSSVIVHWLTAHITQVDRKMAEYIKARDNHKHKR